MEIPSIPPTPRSRMPSPPGRLLLAAAALAACRPSAPPPAGPALAITTRTLLIPQNGPCPGSPRLEAGGDSVVITGTFHEAHSAPYEAKLIHGPGLVTLLLHTRGYGSLNVVSSDCYRAVVRPLAPDGTRCRWPTCTTPGWAETCGCARFSTPPSPFPGGSWVDPDNPVVKLCVEGMRAEGAGRPDDARVLFARAWDARTDDWEACVAAHYLARHQPTPQDALRWNQEALDRAHGVTDDRVRGFFPSLYLNLGHAHEQLGDLDQARRFYDRAAAESAALPDDRYGSVVRQGIRNGQGRVPAPPET